LDRYAIALGKEPPKPQKRPKKKVSAVSEEDRTMEEYRVKNPALITEEEKQDISEFFKQWATVALTRRLMEDSSL